MSAANHATDPAALDGLHVLVTRPARQAQPLCARLVSCGARPLRFPTLEILEPADTTALQQLARGLDRYDWAIFISTNAAEYGVPWLERHGRPPERLRYAVVGPATEMALKYHALPVHVRPSEQYDAEGLLAHPQLADIAGQRVLIFRGEDGNETLGATLRERGATVDYAACYRAVRPHTDPAQLHDWLEHNSIHVVTATSVRSLENLLEMTGEDHRDALRALPLAAISTRVARRALELGFSGAVSVAPTATDAGVVKAIELWREESATE